MLNEGLGYVLNKYRYTQYFYTARQAGALHDTVLSNSVIGQYRFMRGMPKPSNQYLYMIRDVPITSLERSSKCGTNHNILLDSITVYCTGYIYA